MARKNHNNRNSSPQKSNGRIEAFSFTDPNAASVLLAGDFTDWQQKPISLAKGVDGIWRTTVELQPGTHHYRFLVDGQWRDDPKCAGRVPNPYGSQDGVREVV